MSDLRRLTQAIQAKFSGFARSVVELAVGTVASRAILLLALPLLSRIYTPDSIGVWFLVASGAMALAILASLRYDLAIVLPKDDAEGFGVVRLCFLLNFVLSGVVLLIAAIFREDLAHLIDFAGPSIYLLAIPILMPLTCGQETCATWLTRKGKFRTIAIARFADALCMTSVQVLLGWCFTPHTMYLIVGTVAGQAVGQMILLWPTLRTRPSSSPTAEPVWSRFKQLIYRYRYYPMYMAPYSFIGRVSKRLVPFLLAIFATADVVGHFAMAYQVAFMPITVITRSLSQVVYPKLAREMGTAGLDQFLLRIMNGLAAFVLPPLILFLFHADWLLALLLGPNWGPTATYVTLLSLPCFIHLVSSWLDRVYDATGRQRLAVGLQISYDALSLGLLVFMLKFSSVYVAVATYCGITALYRAIWLGITFRVAGYPTGGVFRLMTRCVVLAAILIAAYSAVDTVFAGRGALAAGITICVATQVIVFTLNPRADPGGGSSQGVREEQSKLDGTDFSSGEAESGSVVSVSEQAHIKVADREVLS